MKLLPIVGRELRESSRRRGTYWLRVRVAFQAVVIGIAAYVINVVNPAMKLGTVLFWGLAGVSMLFCLLAGRRSTADCLSQEKREGTLGLLFLTDLKGYDVVLGKLAATSVTGLYALLAVFPVLAVPLLTGGMTNGEVGRMVAVLTNTFFLSIAIGIFASAISRDYRAAMAANFLLWLALVGAPVAWGIGLEIATKGSRAAPVAPALFYSCPIFSFLFSGDANYSTRPDDFWWSIVVTHLLAWVLVLLACWIVPRTWGDKPARAPSRQWHWRDLGSLISYGSAARRAVFRKEALDRNAYFWHAARARVKPLHVWLFLAVAGGWWVYCWVENGHIWLDEATYVATAVMLNSAFKLWITLEAGQRLGEDRRSGAFELLLATPLAVADILRGQWLALRRQFLKPLLVVIVVESIFIAVLHRGHKFETLAVTALLLMLPLDIAALICVAMSAALRSKSQTQATVVAVSRILILPWVVFGIVHAVTAVLYWLALVPQEPNQRFELAQWFGIGLAVDLIFGLQAWRSLRHDFRRLATESPAPTQWRSSLRRAAARMGAPAGRVVPPRLRIPVMAVLGIVAALGIVHIVRARHSDFPPPVVVSITQSNAPLRIFPGGSGVFLVLPDGSLWRWGATGAGSTPRAAMPEQMGTNGHWLKAVGAAAHCLGLRTDGTVWEWGLSNGTNLMAPRLAIPGSNWVDIGTGPQWGGSIALRKDGTIWTWGNFKPSRTASQSAGLARVGTASNWTAVSRQNSSYLGLRSDGTLWAWGVIVSSKYGSYLAQKDVDDPVQLCADTNWISLDASGQARNRAGELWDTAYGFPDPYAGAATVCRRISADWAADHIESAPFWMNCQIRSDGTLWATALAPGQWYLPAYLPASASTAMRQMGNRSDWVAVWGVRGTAFGLTADGTLWAWGYDLGHDTVVNYRTRIHLAQAMLSGRAPRAGSGWSSPPPILEEPQPLMKLVNPPPR
jgi:hypothetical protein